LYLLFGPKNQSFRNTSVKAQPIWTKFNTQTGQGVTTFREFWERSAHFGQNGGWDESHGARVPLDLRLQHEKIVIILRCNHSEL